jgi:putative membrane protein
MTERSPGAQAERTALAWRRTALGVGTGAAVAGRLAAPTAGVAAFVLVVVGAVVAVLLSWTATRRYRTARRALAMERDVPGAGLPTALLAALASLTGLLALAYVLAEA